MMMFNDHSKVNVLLISCSIEEEGKFLNGLKFLFLDWISLAFQLKPMIFSVFANANEGD